MGEAAERVMFIYAAPPVLFDAAVPANDTRVVPEYRWIHCSNEGKYLGHHQGEFDLTRATFESFIKNFRQDPQFKQGSLELDGKTYTGGVQEVLQFDYEHASEQPSYEGSIPSAGAPAIGWVLDLAIRNGPDGKAQLWAFAKLGDQIRGQILRNEYRSVSIAFTLDGVHWVTGADIGPMLTSIAFTNHPYMRDLTPLSIAASRRTSQPTRGAVRSSSDSSEAPVERDSTRTGAHMEAQFRDRLCAALKIKKLATDEEVVGAAEDSSGAAAKLKSLLESLGNGDFEQAMKSIPILRSAQEAAQGLLNEINALLQQDATADGELATADAQAAMKAANLSGEGAQKALVAYRNTLVGEEVSKIEATRKSEHQSDPRKPSKPTVADVRAARAEGRKRFLGEYGVKTSQHATLAQTLVAGANGAQFEPPQGSGKPLPVGDGAGSSGDAPQTITIKGLSGRNRIERVITHLRKSEPGFEKLSWDAQCARAGALVQSANVTLVD